MSRHVMRVSALATLTALCLSAHAQSGDEELETATAPTEDARVAKVDELEQPPPVPKPNFGPPPPTEPPPPTPVEEVGGAKWSPTLGFVQRSGPKPAEKDSTSSEPGVDVPSTVDLGLSGIALLVSGGMTKLNPVNDGVTDDATATTVLEGGFLLRAEFRSASSLIAPWFDLGGWYLSGQREETEPASSDVVLKVEGLRAQGRFGVDLQPLSFVAVGPLLGYRVELYDADLDRGEIGTELTDNSLESDSGLLYGAHVRLRTPETPQRPSLLFVDASLVHKPGDFVSGTYGGLEAGVRFGELQLGGFIERRLSTSGSFGAADVADLSQGFSHSMPVEQRLGLIIGGVLDGRS